MVLSLLVLGIMVYEILAKPPENVMTLLRITDNILCFFFLGDVAIRFWQSDNKRKFFLGWGLVDLIASLPFLDQLRWGRAARLVRILRLLRAFRSMRWVIANLFRDRGKGAVLSAALITVLVMFGSSIAILTLEADHESANIKSAGDALWWTMTTITTVGYGDHYPVTFEGRCVGAVVMLTGISLLAVITGAIASAFTSVNTANAVAATAEAVAPTVDQRLSLEDVLAEVRALRHEMSILRGERPPPDNPAAPQAPEQHGSGSAIPTQPDPGLGPQPESAGGR